MIAACGRGGNARTQCDGRARTAPAILERLRWHPRCFARCGKTRRTPLRARMHQLRTRRPPAMQTIPTTSRLFGLAVMFLCLAPTNASAYKVRLAWRPVAGASGYKLYATENG